MRYQNPLPPPPFPPKLLIVPTDVERYASYEFLQPAVAEREIPMIVDAEIGMPLELGREDDGFWSGDYSCESEEYAQSLSEFMFTRI